MVTENFERFGIPGPNHWGHSPVSPPAAAPFPSEAPGGLTAALSALVYFLITAPEGKTSWNPEPAVCHQEPGPKGKLCPLLLHMLRGSSTRPLSWPPGLRPKS